MCPAAPTGGLDRALCFVASWEVPVLLGFLLLCGVAVFLWWRGRSQSDDDLPALVFSMESPPGRFAPPQERAREAPPPERSPAPVSPDDASANPGDRMVLRVGNAATAPGTREKGVEQGVEKGPVRPPDSEVVRFQAPPEGTLQLLPGRLEVEKGPGSGREIRFVRVPGRPAEVTFGRSEGPDFLHVQLDSPTVSRSHARMRFLDGSWRLANESGTNPTRVNGRSLDSAEVILTDGDRVEIGEITFHFRQERGSDRLPHRSSWYTDRGRRASNQDAVLIRTLPGGREVIAVCDGMGSHHAGGVASYRALEALVETLSSGSDLEFAVRSAHEAVLQAAAEEADREGMGTTMVALLREGDTYALANVGDSRAYRVDGSGIRQLTRDHSFIAEATRDGGISAEEAARSPWRNAVTRNLGSDQPLEVDLFEGFSTADAHRVILCTDGVHGVLGDAEIARIATETADIRELARALSEAALVHGGEDNVAVAAVAFAGTGASGKPTPAAVSQGRGIDGD
jgi:PPM family protein phosphatase